MQQRANKTNAITRMTGGRVAIFGRHDLDTSGRLNVVFLESRAFLSYTRRTLRSLEKNRRELMRLRLLSGLRPLLVTSNNVMIMHLRTGKRRIQKYKTGKQTI